MPHSKSAAKSLRQSQKRRRRNRAVRSRLTAETRKFERALERGDPKEAQTQLDALTKLLHQASATGLIHSKTAGRRQSRLQRRLNELVSAQG